MCVSVGRLAFALGNLTQLKVVLPVREIPSCFLGRVWRAKPRPRARKTPPPGAGSPLQRYTGEPGLQHPLQRAAGGRGRVFEALECTLRAGCGEASDVRSRMTGAPSLQDIWGTV